VVARSVAAFALSMLLTTSAAFAETEPNNRLIEAEGPLVGGQTYTGALASQNDSDWFIFYVSGQVELELAATATTDTCWNAYVTLLDADGDEVSELSIDGATPESIRYTTPPGTTRYYVHVSCSGGGTWGYQFSVTPAAAIVDGVRPFPAPTLTGEPNESQSQAIGPLQGGVDYAGVGGTQNDQDWYYFYAHGGQAIDILVTGNSTGCWEGGLSLSSTEVDLDDVSTSASATLDQIGHIRFTSPPGIRRYDLLGTCDVGGDYRFRIDPPGALSAAPPAAVAPPPPRARPTRCQRLRSAKRAHTRKIRRLKAKRRVAGTRRVKRRYTRRLKIAKHKRAIVVQRIKLNC
jgi:hypothetical protein